MSSLCQYTCSPRHIIMTFCYLLSFMGLQVPSRWNVCFNSGETAMEQLGASSNLQASFCRQTVTLLQASASLFSEHTAMLLSQCVFTAGLTAWKELGPAPLRTSLKSSNPPHMSHTEHLCKQRFFPMCLLHTCHKLSNNFCGYKTEKNYTLWPTA